MAHSGDVVAHSGDWVAHYGDVVAHFEDGSFVSAPDLWGKDPEFEFDISHNDPDALQDHCVIM